MKKLLLIVLLAVGTAAFAQVEKGNVTATANVSFQSQKFEGGDASNTSIFTARGGYFFTDNVEAGVSLMVLGTADITATGYGPYAAYNFLTSGGKFLPYVGANFYHMDFGIDGFDPINQIGGIGGFKYFLTEAVNIDTNLNYTSYLGDFKGSTIALNVGVGINFGKLK